MSGRSRLDPEEVRDLMRAYQLAIATAIRDYGGHLARDIGDGALIYFGWPQAHENDAERAVRAGLAIDIGPPGLRELLRAANSQPFMGLHRYQRPAFSLRFRANSLSWAKSLWTAQMLVSL